MANSLGSYVNIFNIAKKHEHIASIYGKRDSVTDYTTIQILQYQHASNWIEKVYQDANEIYSKI